MRVGRFVVWALALALLTAQAGAAQEPPLPAAPAEAQPATYAPVRLEGRRLFEVAGAEELTAVERASRIERRLDTLVERETPVRPFNARDVRRRGEDYLITLGDEPIMVVTELDAQDSLATAEELALLWGQRMANAVADARAARQNPLRGAGILIRNSFQDLLMSAVRWLPRAAAALLVGFVFWLLAKLIAWIVCLIANRVRMDPNLRQLGRALAFHGTMTVGLIAVFSTLGLETGGIIAALGISGFILGFAFKDILSHFLAGMFLLLGRQFRIGDQILVKEYEGTLERIELRALHLRTYDNRLVIIPNGDVFTSVVTSNTASPFRRRDFLVGIGYEQDIRRAMRIALETVRETPGVLSQPSPDVLVDELAASTIRLRVRFFMNSLRADYLLVGSECMRRVKEAFDREGVSMPTDTFAIALTSPQELAPSLRPADSGTHESGSDRSPVHRAA